MSDLPLEIFQQFPALINSQAKRFQSQHSRKMLVPPPTTLIDKWIISSGQLSSLLPFYPNQLET